MNAKEYLNKCRGVIITPEVLESYYQHKISEIREEDIWKVFDEYDEAINTNSGTIDSAIKCLLEAREKAFESITNLLKGEDE